MRIAEGEKAHVGLWRHRTEKTGEFLGRRGRLRRMFFLSLRWLSVGARRAQVFFPPEP